MYKRKWTKEECRVKYVQTGNMSQMELAAISNRSSSIIAKWSKEDNWVAQRERYMLKTHLKNAEEKAENIDIEISDEIEKMETINDEHIIGYKLFRNIATQWAIAVLERDEPKISKMNKISQAMQKYASVYNNSVLGERTALGMEYMNINRSIELLIKEGYSITAIGKEIDAKNIIDVSDAESALNNQI